jgi:hypothetical protein
MHWTDMIINQWTIIDEIAMRTQGGGTNTVRFTDANGSGAHIKMFIHKKEVFSREFRKEDFDGLTHDKAVKHLHDVLAQEVAQIILKSNITERDMTMISMAELDEKLMMHPLTEDEALKMGSDEEK